MKKIHIESMICVLLIISIIVILIWNKNDKESEPHKPYDDGIEQLDLDSIYLKNSDIQIDFSEVIAGSNRSNAAHRQAY